ncbi:hypothetical protein STENM36S_01567 [Streptomyces tendae]
MQARAAEHFRRRKYPPVSETTHDGTVAIAKPVSPDEGLTPARLAAKYGPPVSGARPSLVEYVRQLWGRRHFILAFSQAKLTAQYSQAKLGQLWQVATPLLNAFVYFAIFGLILNAGKGMPKDVYIPFLVTGVFVFTFTPVLRDGGRARHLRQPRAGAGAALPAGLAADLVRAPAAPSSCWPR